MAAALLAAAALGGGACGGNAFSAGSPDAAADGSLLDVATEGGGGDGGADSGDGASSGKTVYVSTATGNDSSSGLAPKDAKKTIGAGLATAATLGAGAEVHVCAGNYAEASLVVDHELKLLGSYDCVTWTRTASYGFPSFDMKNTTVVTNSAATAGAATLTVIGTAVTAQTQIDGFAVAGASATVGTSYGIDVQGASSPVISNNIVSGATTNTADSAPYGSVGIRIGGSSTAEVWGNVVGGGGGQGGIGSVGIVVVSTAAASVHDDLVSGGTGSATGPSPGIGAAGVAILGGPTTPKPMTGLLVSGADSAGLVGKSVGIYVSGTGVAASLGGCEIQGGTGTGNGTASVGVEIDTTGPVVIQGSRIFGGTRKGGGSQTFGVHAGNVGAFSIVDSEVHAGELTGATVGSYAVGVSIATAAGPVVLDDTIYTGSAGGSAAVQLGAGVSGAVVSGDIVLGGGSSSSDIALSVGKCSGTFASIDHSAAVNFPVLYECTTPSSMIAPDPGSLQTELGTTVVSSTNFEIEDVCAGSTAWCVAEPSCPSTPATACAQSLFGPTFTSSDDGVSGMFDNLADGGLGGAWSLVAGAPCALTRSGVVSNSVPTDIFGTTRGNMPSMGAVQYTHNVACSP